MNFWYNLNIRSSLFPLKLKSVRDSLRLIAEEIQFLPRKGPNSSSCTVLEYFLQQEACRKRLWRYDEIPFWSQVWYRWYLRGKLQHLAGRIIAFNYSSIYMDEEERLHIHKNYIIDHYLKQFNEETIQTKQQRTCGEPCVALSAIRCIMDLKRTMNPIRPWVRYAEFLISVLQRSLRIMRICTALTRSL